MVCSYKSAHVSRDPASKLHSCEIAKLRHVLLSLCGHRSREGGRPVYYHGMHIKGAYSTQSRKVVRDSLKISTMQAEGTCLFPL